MNPTIARCEDMFSPNFRSSMMFQLDTYTMQSRDMLYAQLLLLSVFLTRADHNPQLGLNFYGISNVNLIAKYILLL